MTLNNVWNIISMSTRWAETISLPPHPALPLPPDENCIVCSTTQSSL